MISKKSDIGVEATEATRAILGTALNQGYSVSVWRNPLEKDIHIIVSESAKSISTFNIEESEPGFLFSPFNKEDNKIFLPADHYYHLNGEKTESHHRKNELVIEKLFSGQPKFFKSAETYSHAEEISKSQKDYRMFISDCVHHVRSGRFEKIVPSRKKLISISESFDLIRLFNQLCEEYPHAMVSLISTPHSGTWIGATPEPLISIDKEGIFKTVALAGTQPYHAAVSSSQVSWKQKEIEEQAFVQRYIINCFKKIRLREFSESGPRTVRAGNLLHLRTDFSVDMNEVRYPELGTVMLNLLHPTSAICGMPLEPALDYLIRHEGYDREFYAGYLGPVGIQNETNLFVNLRCMKWQGLHAWLFAGAGVTADSNPDSEMMETELKMQTLLRLIQNL